MGKIVIAYRRPEDVDLAGRLYDRLSGYYGVAMVQLVQSNDTPTRISESVRDSDVLLAVIDELWAESLCEDRTSEALSLDPVRCAVESAVALEKIVVPILIHNAPQLSAEVLPQPIAELADAPAVEVKSGLPFNTDVKKLIDHLEQAHNIQAASRRFPLERILIPAGILLVILGGIFVMFLPLPSSYVDATLRQKSPYPMPGEFTQAAYRQELLRTVLMCTLPLSVGPVLIVAGSRWCCLTKDARANRQHFATGVGRRRAPKSGLSVLCLAVGLAAMGLGVIATIPALLLGVWAWLETHRAPGWVRGRSLAAFGMLVSLIGIWITLDLQLGWWSFDRWLGHVERAEVQLTQGEVDRAIESFQAASDNDLSFLYAWSTSMVLRCEVQARHAQLTQALEGLSDIISRLRPIVFAPNPPGVAVYPSETGVLRLAYGFREQILRALGEHDQADLDREELTRLTEEFRSSLAFLDGIDLGLPVAPRAGESETQPAAPLPPAPVISPQPDIEA